MTREPGIVLNERQWAYMLAIFNVDVHLDSEMRQIPRYILVGPASSHEGVGYQVDLLGVGVPGNEHPLAARSRSGTARSPVPGSW